MPWKFQFGEVGKQSWAFWYLNYLYLFNVTRLGSAGSVVKKNIYIYTF